VKSLGWGSARNVVASIAVARDGRNIKYLAIDDQFFEMIVRTVFGSENRAENKEPPSDGNTKTVVALTQRTQWRCKRHGQTVAK